MKSITAIALTAFKECVRDKILINLLVFTALLMVFSLLLGDWSVFARDKVIKDFSLGVMSVFGLLTSIFMGVGLMQKEIIRKTVLSLLAKPIPRWYLILGKFLGLELVLGLNLLLMTIFFLALLWFNGSGASWMLMGAIYLIFVEMSVLVALALLFASFSTPFLSALLTLGGYAAGHLSYDVLHHLEFLTRHGDRIPGGAHLPAFIPRLSAWIYYIVPNLENFNVKDRVAHQLQIAPSHFVNATLYGGLYILLFLFLTCVWFNRRDFG